MVDTSEKGLRPRPVLPVAGRNEEFFKFGKTHDKTLGSESNEMTDFQGFREAP